MKIKKVILALDLGTKTGWALRMSDNQIISGVESFVTNRFSSSGMRFVKFSHFLTELQQRTRIERVYFEEVRRHLGTDAAHVYGGFMAILTAWCETNQIQYEGVPVGTIKKYMTGKGNANKEEMIESVQRFNESITEDNEADAYALLLYVLDRLDS